MGYLEGAPLFKLCLGDRLLTAVEPEDKSRVKTYMDHFVFFPHIDYQQHDLKRLMVFDFDRIAEDRTIACFNTNGFAKSRFDPFEVMKFTELIDNGIYVRQDQDHYEGPCIPKIIHQFKPANPNEPMIKAMASWKTYNPEYEYRLWDEEAISVEMGEDKHSLPIDHNQRLQRLRFIILDRYGGFFIDPNLRCIKSLSAVPSCHKCAFYATYLSENHNPGVLSDEFIGSPSGSPLLAKILTYYQEPRGFTDRHQLLTACLKALCPEGLFVHPSIYFHVRIHPWRPPTKFIMVNLDRRTDRLATFTKRFAETGLTHIYRFSAIDGQKLTLRHPDVKYLNIGLRKGTLACTLGHLALYRQLVADPANEAYVIIEDDVEFGRNFGNKCYRAIERLNQDDPGWLWLFLGCINREHYDPNREDEPEVKPLIRRNYGCSAFAYVISKEGARALIELIESRQCWTTLDDWIGIHQAIPSYITDHHLCYSYPWSPAYPDTDIQHQTDLIYGFDDLPYYCLCQVPKAKWMPNRKALYEAFLSTDSLFAIIQSQETELKPDYANLYAELIKANKVVNPAMIDLKDLTINPDMDLYGLVQISREYARDQLLAMENLQPL